MCVGGGGRGMGACERVWVGMSGCVRGCSRVCKYCCLSSCIVFAINI